MTIRTRMVRMAYDVLNNPVNRKLMLPNYLVLLNFPPRAIPRWGYGKPPHKQLARIFEKHRANFRQRIERATDFADLFEQIAANDKLDGSAPTFYQNWFTGLDAIAFPTILVETKPKLLLEIGSGYSTKLARAAIEAYSLPTRLVSCDPAPRANIIGLPDEIHRQMIETLDPSYFDQLQPGDVLFIDSSHRALLNSDVTMLFLEVIPRLRTGVVVHIHDISLPFDYPPHWVSHYYSEQYLLAAMMLANPEKFEVLWSSAFINEDESLSREAEVFWQSSRMTRAREYMKRNVSGSIWLRIAQGSS